VNGTGSSNPFPSSRGSANQTSGAQKGPRARGRTLAPRVKLTGMFPGAVHGTLGAASASSARPDIAEDDAGVRR
jgi:hypothetical protein